MFSSKQCCGFATFWYGTIEEGRAVSKHLAIFFPFPSKKFLPTSFQIQLLETSSKTEGTKTKVARCLFFLQSYLTVHILPSLSAC
jgi:hypothetical protein